VASRYQPRHCERSEAIHLTAQRKNGLLRRFAPRNDDHSKPQNLLAVLKIGQQRRRGPLMEHSTALEREHAVGQHQHQIEIVLGSTATIDLCRWCSW
jgi:hypothetical protein